MKLLSCLPALSGVAALSGIALLLASCQVPTVAPAPAAPAAPPAAPAAPTAGGPGVSKEAPDLEQKAVTAVKVSAVSTDAGASYWNDAPVVTVNTKSPLEGEPDGPDVNIQAAYDDQSIAMKFVWADAEASMLKNAWMWDGKAFTKSGDEDRVQLLWPIESNAQFATKGCGAACHNQDPDEKKWWMGSESADQRYDVWHWKSARTNPVNQSDDQWVGIQEDKNDPESARHGDAKESGGYKDNLNEAQDGPAFMHGSDLAAQVIMAGQEVPIDTGKLPNGAVVPGFVIAPAVGSRGDLTANGVWADGKWTVVLVRALNTNNDDDVAFTPPKRYPFGLSVTNHGGGTDHTNAANVLVLEWK
jgi:hypothetical protein